jgi:hypothetical protein
MPAASAHWLRATDGALSLEGPFGLGRRARQPKRRTRDLGRGSRVRSACGGGSEHAHRIHALALTLPGSCEDMRPLHALCTLVRSASVLSRAHCRPHAHAPVRLAVSTIP